MNRIIVIFAIVFVLTIRSGETIRCYECDTLQNVDCKNPKKYEMLAVECSVHRMQNLYRKMKDIPAFKNVSQFFDVDIPRSSADIQMACAKMILKVGDQDVTIRNCQPRNEIYFNQCNVLKASNKLQFCEVCHEDVCNGSTVSTPTVVSSILCFLGYILLQSVGYYGA